MAKRKKAGKAKGGSREILVVASKVKGYVKGKRMNTSADAIAAISDRVYCLLDEATSRTKANGRKTVKPQDV